MAQKIASFQNRGMIRDNSISKINNEFAYENFNIRITPNGEDTLLSITNEKGNEIITVISETEEEFEIKGTLIGHAVLNSYLILFTTDDNEDHIYRIHYDNSEFTGRKLFNGHLNFSAQNPIETITYYESEDIQKVYWVDGRNQPRMINFMKEDYSELTTLFDFVTTFNTENFHVDIKREFSATATFPSGVIQYIFTYSNKNGQETNIVHYTPLYYLSKENSGADAESSVNCQFNISVTSFDNSFDYLNIYSLIRTSYNITPQVSKIASIEIKGTTSSISYTDTNTNKVSVDPTVLLYIGGREIIAGTLTQKDNTLFLGDLTLKHSVIDDEIKQSIQEGKITVDFVPKELNYTEATGLYPYESQLEYSSQNIKGFKGGEFYRIGIRFRTNTGETSPVYYVKLEQNTKYPEIVNNKIITYYPKLTLDSEFVGQLTGKGYTSAQAMIMDAKDSDRVIAAQGLVCPTLFNLKQRCSNNPFSISSWFTRVENSAFTVENMEPLNINSTYSDEVQCMQDESATAGYMIVGDSDEVSKTKHKAYALVVRNSGLGGNYGSFGLMYIDLDEKKQPIPAVDYSSHILVEYPMNWVNNKWDGTVFSDAVKAIKTKAGKLGWNLSDTEIISSLRNGHPHGDVKDEKLYIVELTSGIYYKDGDENKGYDDKRSAGGAQIVHTVNGSNEQSNYDISWNTNALACIQTLESMVEDGKFSSYMHIIADSTNDTLKNNHVRKYGNYYFLDKNIVTFHTPELTEYNKGNFDNTTLSFRIVGTAPITALIANHKMNVSQGYSSSNASGENPNLNIPNISNEDKSYFYYPLYIDSVSDDNNGWLSNEGNYYIYPWHKEGSIMGRKNDNTGEEYSKLNYHTTGRLWFSYKTSYFKNIASELLTGINNGYWKPKSLKGIRVWDSEEPTLLQIDTVYGAKLYQATYDYMLTMTKDITSEEKVGKYDTGYPVYYVADSSYSPDIKDLPEGLYPKEAIGKSSTSFTRFYDPIRIQYKSPRHIVLTLGQYTNTDKTVVVQGIPTLSPEKPQSEIPVPSRNIKVTTVLPWVDSESQTVFGDILTVLYPKISNANAGRTSLPEELMFQNIDINSKVKVFCSEEDMEELNIKVLPVNSTFTSTNTRSSRAFNMSIAMAQYRTGVVIYNESNEYKFIKVTAPLDYTDSPYPAPYNWENHAYINGDTITVSFKIQIAKYNVDEANIFPTVTVTHDYDSITDITVNNSSASSLENLDVLSDGAVSVSFKVTKPSEQKKNTVTVTCNGLEEQKYTASSIQYDITYTPAVVEDLWSGIEEKSISALLTEGIVDTEYITEGVLQEYTELDGYYKFKDSSTEDFILIDQSTISPDMTVSEDTYTVKGQLKELEDGQKYLINVVSDTERYTTVSDESVVMTHTGGSSSVTDITNETLRWYEFKEKHNDTYNADQYVLQRFGGSTVNVVQYDKNNENELFQNANIATETTIESETIEVPNSEGSVFIGELYDADKEEKYLEDANKIPSDFELQQMTFIPSGKFVSLNTGRSDIELHAEEGDTYFQRWDNVRTLPLGEEDTNSVVDICSFMVETHQNLDGRYDNQRGSVDVVNTTAENFNLFNEVYNQSNNFFSGQILDDKYSLKRFPSQITWSKTKTPTEEVDTWTNITLASTLDMDGDKGPVRAIRRFHNSIISFQDKGVAEILFNSRTQLATTEGVPIELANSGKVDGKRYISDKDGCLNKWSIVETSNGIYFIDDLNTSLNVFNGQMASLSSAKGFKNWVADHSSTNIWNPVSFANTISFWDRASDDVYFVTRRGNKANVLCYNEFLQQFTSFYSYGNVPMMANLQDKFIAFRDGSLWTQGKTDYCNLFGEEQDFYVQYRIAPEPYSDKVFTNIEYKADTFSGNELTNNTFDFLKVWNEYQDTGDVEIGKNRGIRDYPSIRRKFRVWRMDIPRDKTDSSDNKYGLNRIRNPWIHLKLTKKYTDERMVFHDLSVRYL